MVRNSYPILHEKIPINASSAVEPGSKGHLGTWGIWSKNVAFHKRYRRTQ